MSAAAAAARFVFGASVAAVIVWSSPGAPLARQTPAPVTPTFARDIAPIITARCAPCHREGGAAPFALTSFEDVSSRIGTIARVVETREMPPWLPSEGAETFAGARALSAAEREVMLRDNKRYCTKPLRGSSESMVPPSSAFPI